MILKVAKTNKITRLNASRRLGGDLSSFLRRGFAPDSDPQRRTQTGQTGQVRQEEVMI